MGNNISACKLLRRCLADYYAKKLHKKRAAGLFFIIEPIKSSIAVIVVVSLTPF